MDGIPDSMARAMQRIADIQAKIFEVDPAADDPVRDATPFVEMVRHTASPRRTPPPDEIDTVIRKAAERYGLRPNLLRAVIQAESGFNPRAFSGKGASGLMQLMPNTAAALGVSDPFDPEQNIMGGAQYLRQQLDRFGGDERMALAAYNAGPGNVLRYHGVPPFSETQGYITRVLSLAADDAPE